MPVAVAWSRGTTIPSTTAPVSEGRVHSMAAAGRLLRRVEGPVAVLQDPAGTMSIRIAAGMSISGTSPRTNGNSGPTIRGGRWATILRRNRTSIVNSRCGIAGRRGPRISSRVVPTVVVAGSADPAAVAVPGLRAADHGLRVVAAAGPAGIRQAISPSIFTFAGEKLPGIFYDHLLLLRCLLRLVLWI